ncbi:hypothetical protein SPRG_05456 [Saprolegnia parasitica CBS 223.65]|uniref:RING-type domain-containing protein n=1 Tax=Saprolegnia parasitica (strain CBS 223.65) TaxID=695850 RepID=A0A067CRY6_SAPPC|nr:hypothetical protein SPRG_05456 [Saprolegnia parasitica CBS 223.65]KDO29276.1 hypothetical protein SPRG_05456 [Saprolegnia parasitica CBS 223.65]|eukprot:XP_012200090.1 hypothetical protein SPRG_05456 [Saprolegnia parasitica CBS 223.65]
MQQQQYKSPPTTATTSTVPNEPAMAFVPLAKWSTAVPPATAGARSRNIDIPNSKPRLRTKPAAAPSSAVGLSRVAAPAPAKRPSSGSHAASSASTTAAGDACFKWHSRPPRGNTETSSTKPSHLTSFQRLDDQAAKLKRTKKAKSVTAPRRLSTDHMWESPAWTQGAHSTSMSKDDSIALGRGDCHDVVFRPAATATLRAREAEPPPLAFPVDGSRSNDVVENLARALLSDCINKRQRETLKTFKVEIVEPPPAPSSSSSSSCGGASCCGSPKEKAGAYDDSGGGLSCSSSDDELNQLHAMDPSFVWDESGRPDDAKPWRETAACQDVDPMMPTSSPESDCFYEEKGLPKEVRYSLPIAYGTVHETSKQCTICQLAYEIGSHIVTLTPCQHFFHALCVDKWLWNHTTCPLCRKEVVYEAFGGVRGTACPDEDRESLRKKMRSQCAEFRPLNPLPVETLDVHFSSLQLHDARRPPAVTPLDYLVCPVAQRTWRK